MLQNNALLKHQQNTSLYLNIGVLKPGVCRFLTKSIKSIITRFCLLRFYITHFPQCQTGIFILRNLSRHFCQIVHQTDGFNYVTVFPRSIQIQTLQLDSIHSHWRFFSRCKSCRSVSDSAPVRDFSSISNYKRYRPKH